MDKVAKGKSEASRRANTGQQRKGAMKEPQTPVDEQFPKGAMREPEQMPSKEGEDLKEVKEALQDLEEEKGDWSKGG